MLQILLVFEHVIVLNLFEQFANRVLGVLQRVISNSSTE